MMSVPDSVSNLGDLLLSPKNQLGSLFLLLCCAVIFGAADIYANPAPKTLSKYRSDLDRLQENISNQETKRADGIEKENNTLTELEDLDRKLLQQQARLDELDVNILKQDILIEGKEEEFDSVMTKHDGVEKHLLKRITAYYTMGELGLLNVTFSSKTLPELLTFKEAFDTLISYDRELLTRYKETMDELERAKRALELEKLVAEDFHNQVQNEKRALVETKKQKNNMLLYIQTQSKLQLQAILEMEEASERLVGSILSVKKAKQDRENVFLRNKGRLPAPTNGSLITRFLEEKTSTFGKLKKYKGIELLAPDGEKIIAVSDGVVTFSGYLQGFGNTIKIHHGYQYYTITSRIEKIISKKGQKVRAKETIGFVGDTATLFGEGLYFEIQHGRESLDPLKWLNPALISASAGGN